MHTNKLLLIASLVFSVCFTGNAQEVISKLVIESNEVYTVGPDNRLLVDTLIMHDKAVIKFTNNLPGLLGVNTAFIGNKCTIESRGRHGSARRVNGVSGEHGGALIIDLHFASLGDLTIDTKGGNGEKGKDGRYSNRPERTTITTVSEGTYTRYHTTSVAGGAGGNGGRGGDIKLTYSTDGFVPNFNQERGSNAIILISEGGKGGKPGLYGKQEGESGTSGQITLINANEQ